MSRKIKLIWDFFGEDSLATAKHHCVHLKEFAEKEQLSFYEIDSVSETKMKAIAYMIVDETNMKIFRDTLKPHRGTLG